MLVGNRIVLAVDQLTVRRFHCHSRLQRFAGIVSVMIFKLCIQALDAHAGPSADKAFMHRIKMNVRAVVRVVIVMSARRHGRTIRARDAAFGAPCHARTVFRAGLGGKVHRLMNTCVCARMHQGAGGIKPSGADHTVLQIYASVVHGCKAGVAAFSNGDFLTAEITGNRSFNRIINALLTEAVAVRRARGSEHGEGIQLSRLAFRRIPRADFEDGIGSLGGQTDHLFRRIAAGEIDHSVSAKTRARGIVIAPGNLSAGERGCARIRAAGHDNMDSCLLNQSPIGFGNRRRSQKHLPQAFALCRITGKPIQCSGIDRAGNDGKINAAVFVRKWGFRLHRNGGCRASCRILARHHQKIRAAEHIKRRNGLVPGFRRLGVRHSVAKLNGHLRIRLCEKSKQRLQILLLRRRDAPNHRKARAV